MVMLEAGGRRNVSAQKYSTYVRQNNWDSIQLRGHIVTESRRTLMSSLSLAERLTAPGPKRILALDGGGIRGLITLGFLDEIERVLRTDLGRPDLLLCDYFDLIGGTSTGAVIASGLAIGMDVAAIKALYLELATKIFTPALPAWVPKPARNLALAHPSPRLTVGVGSRSFGIGGSTRWIARFNPEPLEDQLRQTFGDRTLGDSTIRTGLCIIAKRVDTGSTWPLHNNPAGKYFEKNRDVPLWQAIRASTAAPIYFPPIKLSLGRGEEGAFVDGGVSMANNAALQLLLVAVLTGYRFRWSLGEDQLLLVSVGTGSWSRREDAEKAMRNRVWNWAINVPEMLMADASWQNQLILQALSNTPTPWEIDREVGTLEDDLLAPVPLLSYLRYNVELEKHSMHELQLGNLAEDKTLAKLREMSETTTARELVTIGERAAQRQIHSSHFSRSFDPT